MDPERPHRSTSINNSSSNNNTTSTTSELFICFTSRLSSSSSMKIPSKSILSPGRSREPSSQISLSSSLSRRLRSNGSMKGGQASPMFPTTSGKKRGAGFDNPEPSSPKVTCIGQVRVKTKKQGKKFRACRSKRRGEVSFRKVDHNNNGSNSLDSSNMGHFLSSSSSHQQQQQQQECKKWVHLPVTICEALRTFGSEFNCFLPCRSSCMAKEGKTRGSGNGSGRSSCGFTRWLVAVQEGEVKVKEREIELVVDDVERRESSSEINEMMMMRSSQRRHVFEDIEINDLVNENMGDDDDIEEGEARVSICIPPKNALLLMRCRSDPVKMAALGNKFWETPLPKDEDEVKEEEAENETEEKVEEEQEVVQEDIVEEVEEREDIFEEAMEHQEVSEVSEMFVSCEAYAEQEQTQEAVDEIEVESTALVEETSTEYQEHEQDQEESCLKEQTLTEVEQDQEESSLKEQTLTEVEQEQLESTLKEQTLTEVPFDLENEAAIEENDAEPEPEDDDEEEERETNQERPELEDRKTRETEPESESKESESQEEKLLPECLLLMMCEPKLSMEVSKETWVCSTDFIRWLPEKRKQPVVKQKDGGDEPKRRISVDSNPPRPRPIYLQPPRSSCSFPAAPPMDSGTQASAARAAKGGGGGGSMTTKIEHNHVGFSLTRCKSEPRKSSAKLAPDACCWKNRKLEPTSLGVGAAGVGF